LVPLFEALLTRLLGEFETFPLPCLFNERHVLIPLLWEDNEGEPLNLRGSGNPGPQIKVLGPKPNPFIIWQGPQSLVIIPRGFLLPKETFQEILEQRLQLAVWQVI